MNGFGAQGRATGIRDGQIGSASTRTQRGSRPQDHPSLAIPANTAKAELHRREEAEGTTAELLCRRERTNRLEISGREFFADDVSEAEPACRALDRARDLESEEIPTERRATDLDPLRCHRGERFRAREGRMFPGELDNNAHVRRTSPANMSLPPTVIFKWPGPFAPPGCASGPSSRTTSPRSRRSSGKRYARTIRPRCTSTSTAGGGTASSSPILTATRSVSSPP